MSLLEVLFSRTLVKIKENMTNLEDVLFEPVKSKHQSVEHVPVSMKFEVCKFKHIYIGRLRVKWEEYGIPHVQGTHHVKETKIEVRELRRHTDTLPIANKLYRKAVKTFIRENKPKGFKTCLLEFFDIEETENYEYKFYLNRTDYMLSMFSPKKKR